MRVLSWQIRAGKAGRLAREWIDYPQMTQKDTDESQDI
jgi:hypothetical protein